MRTIIFVLACIVGMTAVRLPARASSIGHVTAVQVTCYSVIMAIQLDAGWKEAPSGNKLTYRVSEVIGTEMYDVTSSNDSTIEIKYLPEWTPHYFVVEARAHPANRPGLTYYRFAGELKIVTPRCNVITPNSPTPGDVRLRHEVTAKCIFGNPIDGRPAKTFTCWNDPEMAIKIENLGGNEVRIRLREKGKCLYGDPTNGGDVKNFTCWDDPKMVWIEESLGNNRYRYRSKATQMCMAGSTFEALPIRNWGCWDDPNMVWVKDPI